MSPRGNPLRRRHGKVDDLPPEMRAAVNTMLADPKCTYAQIATYLAERGHEVSKSAIGRRAQVFAAQLNQLQILREQVAPILAKLGDQPNLDMLVAATELALQQLIEAVTLGKCTKGELAKCTSSIAQVSKAILQTERQRREDAERKASADARLDAVAKEKKLTPETVAEIKALYGF